MTATTLQIPLSFASRCQTWLFGGRKQLRWVRTSVVFRPLMAEDCVPQHRSVRCRQSWRRRRRWDATVVFIRSQMWNDVVKVLPPGQTEFGRRSNQLSKDKKTHGPDSEHDMRSPPLPQDNVRDYVMPFGSELCEPCTLISWPQNGNSSYACNGKHGNHVWILYDFLSSLVVHWHVATKRHRFNFFIFFFKILNVFLFSKRQNSMRIL